VLDTSISGRRVVRELSDLIAERGAPRMIPSDSETELTSNAVLAWSGDAGVGSDTEAGGPSPEDRDDAQLAGRVIVSVDVEDDNLAGEVRSAFAEFEASEVEESCLDHGYRHLPMAIASDFAHRSTQHAVHRTELPTRRGHSTVRPHPL
jgi:hypothetical protein